MLKDAITARDVVDFLNEALRIDPEAVTALMSQRVGASVALADHPSIQVRKHDGEPSFTVGMLGLLNGLFGTIEGGYYDGWGPIKVKMKSSKVIDSFVLTEGLGAPGTRSA